MRTEHIWSIRMHLYMNEELFFIICETTTFWMRTLWFATGADYHECLAVLWAIYSLGAYIEKPSFIVATDHKACMSLVIFNSPGSVIVRWRLSCRKLNNKVIYRLGLVYKALVALSKPFYTSDINDCKPTEDRNLHLNPVLTLRSSGWKRRMGWVHHFWIGSLRRIIFFHSLTLPVRHLLTTTWMILIQIIG